MGARIEIDPENITLCHVGNVAPLVGARIEIEQRVTCFWEFSVAPLVGARIEIST